MSETRTPVREKAKYFCKHLKKENPDYNYLRELFRHIRKNLNVEVESGREKRLPYVPTEEEINKFYDAVWKSRNMKHVVMIKTLLIVFDQSVETWINCHINAFAYFGGVPEVIKLDNLKAGVINANFYEPVYQKEYLRLSKHYDLLLHPCRPYQPKEKGKVESGIKYVKNNFFAGRKFSSYNELISSLVTWQERANRRVHGTTKKVPKELFIKEESSRLKKLPTDVFDMSSWHTRKVARDCHITIENNYYSVPAKYVSSNVLIQLKPKIVQIYSIENELIARHKRVTSSQGVFTTNPSHYAKYKRLCPGFTEYDQRYLEQIEKIGKNCQLFITGLRQDRPKDWYRSARGIVNLRKIYSDDLIDKACLRALHYGVNSYSRVKRMLESNATSLPLPSSKFGGSNARIA